MHIFDIIYLTIEKRRFKHERFYDIYWWYCYHYRSIIIFSCSYLCTVWNRLVGSSSLKWEVTSLLRDGIKGSEQEVIMKALIQLGFEEITEVLYGAVYNLTLDDKMSEDEQRLRIKEMCSTNIINTNLYDFKIKLIEE